MFSLSVRSNETAAGYTSSAVPSPCSTSNQWTKVLILNRTESLSYVLSSACFSLLLLFFSRMSWWVWTALQLSEMQNRVDRRMQTSRLFLFCAFPVAKCKATHLVFLARAAPGLSSISEFHCSPRGSCTSVALSQLLDFDGDMPALFPLASLGNQPFEDDLLLFACCLSCVGL